MNANQTPLASAFLNVKFDPEFAEKDILDQLFKLALVVSNIGSRAQITFRLMDFLQTHGKKAFVDLLACMYVEGKLNGAYNVAIQILNHDLNGALDHDMVPRSADYLSTYYSL